MLGVTVVCAALATWFGGIRGLRQASDSGRHSRDELVSATVLVGCVALALMVTGIVVLID